MHAHNAETAVRPLSGWGRCPVESCRLVRPANMGALREMLSQPADDGEMIPRGLGRSYGDAALNHDRRVILATDFDRMLSFDPAMGILHAEAGVSLADLMAHLLPRGYFVPTTPGTKYITLGGAIAADVHGKNHHRDGSFGDHVQSIELLTADGSVRWCSPYEHADLFQATIGGMGLTGIILSAKLTMTRVPSAYCQVSYRRTANLAEAMDGFDQSDADYRYSVAWVDTLTTGESLGRSVVMLGNDATVEMLSGKQREHPHRLPRRRDKSVPFDLPFNVFGRWTVAAFNRVFYATHPDKETIVDYDRFFYPLDAVAHWNRLYGKRGFVQYQVLMPPPREQAVAGLTQILEAVAASGMGSFLTVLKKCGSAGPGLLSFMSPGYTLTMDLPDTGEKLRRLTATLDRITLDHGGRLYLAKDALMQADTFAIMYPNLPRFRQIKQQYDPEGRFSSSQARRLGIVETS